MVSAPCWQNVRNPPESSEQRAMLLLPTACSGLTVPQTSLGTLKVAPVGMGTLNFPLDKTEDPSTAEALRAAQDHPQRP